MAEKLTDIDLSSITLHETKPRQLAKDSSEVGIIQEDDIETGCGTVHVSVQGDRGKHAIFTYHDIGLNSLTCFQGFFNYEEVVPILDHHFTVYHINAPGQQDGALPLPHGLRTSESDNLLTTLAKGTDGRDPKSASMANLGDPALANSYEYPSMDQLAEMLLPVMQYYGLKSFIGFGVGAGANILSRFALKHPDKVDGLCLINCSAGRSSWVEWGYQKLNSWYLKSGNMTAATEGYLLWHWFGKKTMESNSDLVQMFCNYAKGINPTNMAYFIDSFVKRTDLEIYREFGHHNKKDIKNFKCPVMLVAGESSPHLHQVIDMNSRLDPKDSTWMKFECGGMVHEEAPAKLSQAFTLFLQGMGYVPSLSRSSLLKQASVIHAARQSSTHHAPRGADSKASAPPQQPHTQQTVC